MNHSLIVIISQNYCVYDKILLDQDCLTKYNNKRKITPNNNRRKVTFVVDGIFLHYFLQGLKYGPSYRINFMKQLQDASYIIFRLVPTQKEILDHNWNYRIDYLVRERCELEHVMSWLSTLGGAFSALGDYFQSCAEVAGKISINQLKLAFRLGDPTIVARCKLFISLSLIQQHHFKLAKKIIHQEYINALNYTVLDIRLLNMCKGIWCKLKYEYENYRNCTKKNKRLIY